MTEASILGLPAGSSGYLYLASAGFSLLIAWGLDWTRHHASPYLAGGLALLILISSYHGLIQAEGLTYYSEARSNLTAGDDPTGIRLMRKALELGG